MNKSFLSFLPLGNKKQLFLFLCSVLFFFFYCFSIPAFSNNYPFNYVSIVICFIMCGLMLLYAFLYGKIELNTPLWILLLFNLSMLITHIINLDFSSYPKTIILMSIVAFCIFQFLSANKTRINIFVYIFLLAGIVFALLYLVHYRTEVFSFKNRLGYYFDNPNEIAKEFGYFLCSALAVFILSKKSRMQHSAHGTSHIIVA